MIMESRSFDVVVIGSGPAGQNAAVEAANCGARVLVVERERNVGGACVQYGTIPSKSLRETAVTLTAFRRRSGGVYEINHDSRLSIQSLMTRLDQVIHAHQDTAQQALDMSGVERSRGKAAFVSQNEISIMNVRGEAELIKADNVVIATGSRPRNPANVNVDHENILDSDSILSMSYLPQSLVVLGSGVIACEYASTFAALGVRVVMIDKWPRPMGFLDPDLVDVYLKQFRESGGEFHGGRGVSSIDWDGVSSVRVTFADGEVLTADKALIAQGRIANLETLGLENTSLSATEFGLLAVNEFCQTALPHIYAVGDCIGPPALASASMEQGRRAVRHALLGAASAAADLIPAGIYTIPEMATIGLTEEQATLKYGGAIVGRVDFERLARAHIMASSGGLLKMIADPTGTKLLGVQIAGDNATELVHIGQMAMLGNLSIDSFTTTVFNFPTMAEAYRLAALDIIHRRDSGLSLEPPKTTTNKPTVAQSPI